MKWLCAVSCALDCGIVSWDYCRYLQVARNAKQTNKSACGSSGNKFGTACRVIFLGVGDRRAFQVDFQSIVVN